MGRAERRAARAALAEQVAAVAPTSADDAGLTLNDAGEPVAPLDGRYSRDCPKCNITPNDRDSSSITASHQGSLQRTQ